MDSTGFIYSWGDYSYQEDLRTGVVVEREFHIFEDSTTGLEYEARSQYSDADSDLDSNSDNDFEEESENNENDGFSLNSHSEKASDKSFDSYSTAKSDENEWRQAFKKTRKSKNVSYEALTDAVDIQDIYRISSIVDDKAFVVSYQDLCGIFDYTVKHDLKTAFKELIVHDRIMFPSMRVYIFSLFFKTKKDWIFTCAPDLKFVNSDGFTMLHYYVKKNDVRAVSDMMRDSRVLETIDVRDRAGNTAYDNATQEMKIVIAKSKRALCS